MLKITTCLQTNDMLCIEEFPAGGTYLCLQYDNLLDDSSTSEGASRNPIL